MNVLPSIYKLNKIINNLKNEPIIVIAHLPNSKSNSIIKFNRDIQKLGLKSHKIKNSLAKKIIKRSVFKHFNSISSGQICFIYFNNKIKHILEIKKLKSVNSQLYILGLKIYNKLYLSNQLKNVISINYLQNLRVLNSTLKNCMKYSYIKMVKNSK